MTADQALQYGTLVGVFVVAIMAQIVAYRAKRQAEKEAAEAQKQRDEMKLKAEKTYHLMNSAKAAYLLDKLNDKKLIASLTKNDPGAVALMDEAKRIYDEHMAQQATLDAQLRAVAENKPA